MKTKLFTILLLVIVSFANAQENICADKEKQFREYIANKDFSNANLLWLEVREKCAPSNENIYKLGSEVLIYNIEMASAENKETAVRDLLKIYKKYDAVFPKNTNGNAVKSGMALHNNRVGTDEEIYNYLDVAFKNQPENFKGAEANYLYFKLFYNKFKEGKSNISKEDVIEKYNSVNGLIFQNAKKYPENEAEYRRATVASKALVNDLLTCDVLAPYFEKNFEKNKENVAWLTASAGTLSEKCKTSVAFETVALQLDKLNPTTDSAYFLAEFYHNTRNPEKAVNYFDKSMQLAAPGLEKAKKAYTIASIISNSDKAKSKKMVQIAIENEPSNGKYYLFLANLYASSLKDCGTSPEQQAAVFKLASNVALNAGKTEARLKQTSQKTSDGYLKQVDAKFKGKSVKIACWINETVQL